LFDGWSFKYNTYANKICYHYILLLYWSLLDILPDQKFLSVHGSSSIQWLVTTYLIIMMTVILLLWWKNVSENFSENVQKHFSGIFNYIQKLFHENSEIFSDFCKNYFQVSESPRISMKFGNLEMYLKRVFLWFLTFQRFLEVSLKIISKCLKIPEFRWNSVISEMFLKKLFSWFLTFQKLSAISLKIISKCLKVSEFRWKSEIRRLTPPRDDRIFRKKEFD